MEVLELQEIRERRPEDVHNPENNFGCAPEEERTGASIVEECEKRERDGDEDP